ncbi:hypothetical protein [Pseudomonas sp. PD9R]|uniref:hypothetical protein n=1 Tax=Pseudomonas sp. PD9R TaxID=2853534 RepID=UPI001C44EE1D|nr:hypothetical protein [Pseudomonas sp. PD9R]MBV6821379.1 hypothetical protein [Pseudomonas sp. PD9R]
MEPRVVKLETHVEYIRRELDGFRMDGREHRNETRYEFRIMFSALITATLALAAIGAKGFGWL